ncbi:MAG: GNAT family N-acetyltransferase [Pseudomonadota bacterium]
MSLTVRIAREVELPKLKELLDRSWRETYSPIVGADSVEAALEDRHSVEQLSLDLNKDPEVSLIAEKDGDLIGHVFAIHRDDELYVDRLHVIAKARRSGAARALMDKVAEIAKGRSVLKIRLEVMEANEGAVRFYEALGYTAAERREACGATLPSPSLMMELAV